jgi:dATP pyrophosphohydrolase
MRAPYQVLVIPFRQNGSNREYAVFLRADGDNDIWQFVAGGAEEGESCVEAAVRELFEETGVRVDNPLIELDTWSSVPGDNFQAFSDWPDEVLVVTEYTFAADIARDAITLSYEHTEYRWVGYDSAMKLLWFDGNKTALWELNYRLDHQLLRQRN